MQKTNRAQNLKIVYWSLAIFLIAVIIEIKLWLFSVEFPRSPQDNYGLINLNTEKFPNHHKYKIGLVVDKGFFSESEMAKSYCLTIRNMGGDCYIFQYTYALGTNPYTAKIVQKINELINHYFKTDFLIIFDVTTLPITAQNIPNYFITEKVVPWRVKRWAHAKVNYDGYIDIAPSLPWPKAHDINHPPAFTKSGYHTIYTTNYKPWKFNQLFYCGFEWDKLRSSANYKTLTQGLEATGYFTVYGTKNAWKHLRHSYKGFLPSDGGYSVIKAAQEAGAVLIMHSRDHLETGIPSNRIFMAAASGAVIISDPHPFVIREFGNCALYFDPTKDPYLALAQLKHHVQWIKDNPIEAEAKATCAHNIFLQKFTLEKQLIKITEMHEKVLAARQHTIE